MEMVASFNPDEAFIYSVKYCFARTEISNGVCLLKAIGTNCDRSVGLLKFYLVLTFDHLLI